ncbi:hypothetical protein LXL04_037946 [Taraxacum kok-saghyz]
MATYVKHVNLLQTISLLHFLFTLTCIGSSWSPRSPDEECLALFQFKQSMIHQDDGALCAPSWLQTFHSWNLASNASDVAFDCCSWYGVECSNDDAYTHVIGLDLSESFLCGHINSTSTLFTLVYLQSLNLAMNDFHDSEIPSGIVHLKQLRSLNLSNSGFIGQIPKEISQLMHLSSLDMTWNPLKLHSPNLDNLVQNLTRLEELHLSGVDISSSMPRFLANFSVLRSIKLADCSLWNELPVSIFKLPKLKILDVSSNANLIGSLPKFHNSSLNHLIFLRLSGCSLSGHIPGSLSNLTQLTTLGLADNKFTGFVPSLVRLLKLNVLELTGNKFKNGRFPNWLGKLTELNKLRVYDMNIEDNISPFVANLTKLSVLGMGQNFITGHIPSCLFNLTQLGTLDLQQNQLQGPISSSFSNFKSLQHLFLSLNNFSGRVDLDIFLGLNKLETLILDDNRISVVENTNYTNNILPEFKVLGLSTCNLKEFPAFLRFQNRIEVLLLSRNKIDGMVPVWIWNKNKETLQVIDLSNNSITGFHKHPQFLQWGRLQAFVISNNQVRGQLPIPPQTMVVYDVSNNNFTGEIPPMICEVKALQMLVLSSNNMNGTLPPCFANLINFLLVLDLGQNNFHGIMINGFKHGSQLKYIILSENRFTGRLPRSLTNCTNLEILSLADNLFDDVFPSWLGSLPSLQVMVLRSNKFYGPINCSTTFSSQFPKLRIIDLSNNGFTGQLHPKCFQTWNAIKSVYVGETSFSTSDMSFEFVKASTEYSITLIHKGGRREYNQKILTIFKAIDLSCNHFEGEIPLSIQDLIGLESLNLSNNHFSGHIFPSLGYLKKLESLDLSYNNLFGEIPQQLVQLNFLSIFNVSFNQLHGRIPQGQQFNTFENNSYMGNPRLCGEPLSTECQGSKGPILPPASNASESLLPSERIDWIIIFCGVGSGLAIGIVIGNSLHTKYTHRLRKTEDETK